MNGPGSAPFTLHFDHRGHGAPNIGLPLGGPGIGPFPHGDAGVIGIDRNDFTEAVGTRATASLPLWEAVSVANLMLLIDGETYRACHCGSLAEKGG
jgi:hypothetical protein